MEMGLMLEIGFMRTKRKMVSGILAKKQRTTYISLYPTDGAKKQELPIRPTESINYFRTLAKRFQITRQSMEIDAIKYKEEYGE